MPLADRQQRSTEQVEQCGINIIYMEGRKTMKEVVIVSAVRTPIGSIGGTLKNTLPEKLLATAYEGAIEKAGISKDMFDEVIAGQAKQTTDAPNIARVSSLMLQIPEATPAYTSIVSAPPACRPCSPACSRSSAITPTSCSAAASRA